MIVTATIEIARHRAAAAGSLPGICDKSAWQKQAPLTPIASLNIPKKAHYRGRRVTVEHLWKADQVRGCKRKIQYAMHLLW